MPASHPGHEVLKGWREKTLSPVEVEQTAAHMATCDECRTAVMYADATQRVARAMQGAEEHLEYEQLEALVQGKAGGDERRLMERHLAFCGTCRAELQDLQTLASAPRRSSRRWWVIAVPALTLAAVAAVVVARMNSTAEAPIVGSARETGRTISLDAAGRLRGLEQAPEALQAQVAQALRNHTLPQAQGLEGLRRNADTLLGNGPAEVALRDLAPRGFVVAVAAPRFRWKGPEGASGYVVAVYTTDFRPVVSSPLVNGEEWVCSQTLDAGATYIWTVTATLNGKRITAPSAPEPEARFRVAGRAEQAELEAARATGSDFAVAVTAARLGMSDEAQRAMQRVAIN